MARMRKAGRLWRKNDARAAAERVMVAGEGPLFTVDPSTLFECEAPLEVELGAGRGDFIIARAAAMPERNFIAVELAASVARMMAVRGGRAGLTNLRVLRMDARTLVNLMLPEASVSACHIYFPDPWPKERQAKHRLFTSHFVASLGRTLKADAPLYVATDVCVYAAQIFAMLEGGGFRREPTATAVAGATQTGFARKFIAEGRPVYAGTFVAVSLDVAP
ncbi:MAG: tRNA (guanine(46)-N(7))-methyltransferase TrmB [Candidatus Binataceae bacterium]